MELKRFFRGPLLLVLLAVLVIIITLGWASGSGGGYSQKDTSQIVQLIEQGKVKSAHCRPFLLFFTSQPKMSCLPELSAPPGMRIRPWSRGCSRAKWERLSRAARCHRLSHGFPIRA